MMQQTVTQTVRVVMAAICGLMLMASGLRADTVNVRDLGGVGDGKADDTEAIQKAILADTAEIVIPAGTYRITKTLQFSKVRPGDKYPRERHVRGEGNRTILVWDGEKGGTLLRAYGMGHCQFSGIIFSGQTPARMLKDKTDRAGILFLIEAANGIGNMINHISYCQFRRADVGVQCGTSEHFPTNSDISFEHINMQGLGKFFYTKNNQAVDFLFNFLFVCEVGTVFHFERGGNMLVNNCQVTEADTVLQIDGGGRCCATYLINNLRLEGNGGGQSRRYQLLKAGDICWEQALVRFTGFNDIMWQWFKNSNESRKLPLCEIGPGVNVAFESSAFNGPVATVRGKEGKPASLVIRESTFGYLTPAEAISANGAGYFKTENCFNDHMVPYPDITKWVKLPAMNVPGNAEYTAVLPDPMPKSEKAEEDHAKRTELWIKSLEQK